MARPKLLLADGSATMQRVIELTFADEDVQVVTVSVGAEAIARIPIERPDIVLADIGTTKHSGYEVAAFVRSRPDLAHIPVILLAGAFEPVDEGRAAQSGCSGVLVKPFEPAHVIARVRNLVGGVRSTPTHPGIAGVQRPATRVAGARHVELPARPDVGTIDMGDVESGAAAVHAGSAGPRRFEGFERPADAGVSLDDYFDRLDETFAGLEGGASHEVQDSRSARLPPGAQEGPVMDRELDWIDPPFRTSAPASPRALGAAEDEGPPTPTLADLLGEASAFTALAGDLPLQDGPVVPLPAPPAAAPPAPGVSAGPIDEELVKRVTARVLEQLSPDAGLTMSSIVERAVAEVTARLVREEVEGISRRDHGEGG